MSVCVRLSSGGLLWACFLVGCSSSTSTPTPQDSSVLDVAQIEDLSLDTVDRSPDLTRDTTSLADTAPDSAADLNTADLSAADLGTPLSFKVVTFNTGAPKDLPHDDPPDDGYTSAMAEISDQYYGGLAWPPAIAAAHDFITQVDPDIVTLEEVFDVAECANIPQDAWPGFICETWHPGDPTVAQQVLGPDWQVACHLGRPDKCAAVNRRFGSFRGCSGDLCLDGLDGGVVESCGKGSRIGRGVIDLVDGGTLTLVSVHCSSGINLEDMLCRVAQVDQVFVDLGDGAPAANGSRNLIMGDFNTDPGRLAWLDPSAARWNLYVGPGKPFHFISDVGPNALPSYMNLLNIDNVISDELVGTSSCWSAGVTPGHPPVIDAVYFDHHPLVCEVALPLP